jgi:hypothetical protein
MLYFFLAIIMLLGLFSTSAHAAGTNLKVNGMFEAFRTRPATVNGTVLMAVHELCSYLDADVLWKESNKSCTLTKGDITVILYLGKTTAYVNSEEVVLPAAPQYQSGNTALDILVPLRFVSERFGAKVGWEASTSTITLDTGKEPMQVITINQPTKENSVVMSYDQALKSALKANSTILNLGDSIEYLQEQHNEAVDSAISAGSDGMDLWSAQFKEILRGLRSIEDNQKNIPYNKAMVEATTEYMLRSALAQIATDEMDLQMLNESVKLKEANVKNLSLKLELGMASQNDLTKAQQELRQDKVNADLMVLRLEDDKASLNMILQVPFDKEHIVDFDPEVEPVNTSNISGFVRDAAAKDPSLAIKQTAIDAAKYVIDTFSSTEQSQKLEKQNDLNTASRDYDDTKRALETAARSSYNKLVQQQENEKSLSIDLEKAWDAYNTLVVSYQAGLATIQELDQAKLGILQAEAALKKNEYSHWTLSFAIKHPFLLASGSSSASAS